MMKRMAVITYPIGTDHLATDDEEQGVYHHRNETQGNLGSRKPFSVSVSQDP